MPWRRSSRLVLQSVDFRFEGSIEVQVFRCMTSCGPQSFKRLPKSRRVRPDPVSSFRILDPGALAMNLRAPHEQNPESEISSIML